MNNRQHITVSQAVFLLVDNAENKLEKFYQLRDMLSSLSNFDSLAKLHFELEKIFPSQYKIPSFNDLKSNISITIEDPVWRYFETHLAYEVLQEEIEIMDLDTIKDLFTYLRNLASNNLSENENKIIDILIEGKSASSFNNFILDEYHDLIIKLKLSPDYQVYSSSNKIKLLLLAQISFLTFELTGARNLLPYHGLYSDGFYHPSNRGRISKGGSNYQEQYEVHSQHLGIMKSYMPLPMNDIALAPKPGDFLRGADRSNLDHKSAWAANTFSLTIHEDKFNDQAYSLLNTFSNSISGLTLMHMRMLIRCNESFLLFHNYEKLHNYLKCLFSLMAFTTGGHSYHELYFPLTISEIQSEFKHIKSFEKMNFKTLLIENKKSVSTALEATLKYNRQILNRKNIHTSLLEKTTKRNISTSLMLTKNFIKNHKNNIFKTFANQSSLDGFDSFADQILDLLNKGGDLTAVKGNFVKLQTTLFIFILDSICSYIDKNYNGKNKQVMVKEFKKQIQSANLILQYNNTHFSQAIYRVAEATNNLQNQLNHYYNNEIILFRGYRRNKNKIQPVLDEIKKIPFNNWLSS